MKTTHSEKYKPSKQTNPLETSTKTQTKNPTIKNLPEKKSTYNDDNILKINENYAKKFDEIKKKEAIEKAKQKYGKDFLNKQESDGNESSEPESEDSEGQLVNDKVLEKFLETIVTLQDDNKVKELVLSDKPIFDDEDFTEKKSKIHKTEKSFTIKDQLLNFNTDEILPVQENEDIYSVNYKEKKFVKKDFEKEEFIQKALEVEENPEDDGDFIDDGFLKVKKTDQVNFPFEQEQKKFNNLKPEITNSKDTPQDEGIYNIKLDDILKKKKNVKNVELLKKFWGEGQNLDKNEKFLRNYILSEAWLENDENFINRKMFLIDKEDEEKDEVFEVFEEKYNFRYEEDGGANITTHRRDMESFRIKDDSKKIKRKEREIEKKEEKTKYISELTIAKQAMKNEMKEKLQNLERIAGTDKIKELADELEKDFDPENFDRIMNKIYNEEYR